MHRSTTLFKLFSSLLLILPLTFMLQGQARAAGFAHLDASAKQSAPVCTPGDKPGEEECIFQGRITRPEAWLVDTLQHNPRAITELDIYRNAPLAQVWQNARLITVHTPGTLADANNLLTLSIAAGVDWHLRTASFWDLGADSPRLQPYCGWAWWLFGCSGFCPS